MAIHVLYQNVRGLRTKLPIFKLNLLSSSFDLVLITESWLNDGVFDHELIESGYTIFRNDRCAKNSNKKDGGGVFVIVRDHFGARHVPEFEGDTEDVWVVMNVNNKTVYVCCVYLPPGNESASASFIEKLERIMEKMGENDLILVCGDFNCSTVRWECQPVAENMSAVGVDSKWTGIIDTFNFLELKQFNKINNLNNRILDLVLCNKFRVKELTRSCVPIVNEDDHHPALEFLFDIKNYSYLKEPTEYRLNFKKADFEAMNTDLSEVDWISLLSDSDVESQVEVFYSILKNLIQKYVPRTKCRKKFPLFYSKELIKTIKSKLKVHKKFKVYKNKSDYDLFKNLRTLSKYLMVRDFHNYLDQVEQKLSQDSTEFFKFISHKKKHGKFPSQMKNDNVEVSSSEDIANLFAQFFSGAFESSTNNHDNINEVQNLYNSMYLSEITLNEIAVEKALNALNPDKGPGPDDIPPLFLIKCRINILKPLTIIFNTSLHSGIFPHRWKLSKIVPVHKGGAKNIIKNYRPISILSAIPKLFESLVYDFVSNHVKHIIIENQHGFVRGRNLETNLLNFLENLNEGFESHSQVDSVYTDFKKAFDKINHAVLLRRLAEVGICGSLLRWIQSYILHRSQFVCVNGQYSGIFHNGSGVPQGSHLGPLFFIIYLNNISCCFHYAKFLVYADDLKIFLRISSFEDCMKLQEDLDRFYEYCSVNFLFLNFDKCLKISFTRNVNTFAFDYTINQVIIKQEDAVRDLGVFLDSKLTFDVHINGVIESSNKMLGFVLRHGKLFKKNETLLTLYYSFVFSRLNFATSIWNPQYRCYISRLESVQHKFLRFLSFRSKIQIIDHDYTEIQRSFKILSLENRRRLNDMCLLFKLVNNILNVPEILESIDFRVPERRLRSRDLFAVPFRRVNVTQNSPLCRMLSTFNSFSCDVDIFNVQLHELKRILKLKLPFVFSVC